VKCGTCGRPYNRTFSECPFCARAEVGYRAPPSAPAPSPLHEEFKAQRRAIEEAEARGRRLVGMSLAGGVVAVIFASAASGVVAPFGHGHLTPVFVVGVLGGAVAAWIARRVAEEANLAVTLFGFFAGYVMAAAAAYLVIIGLNAASGSKTTVTCTATRISYAKRGGAAVSAYFHCALPNGAVGYGSEGVSKIPFQPSVPFTLVAKRGALGIWTYDPESARAIER